jgi:hypothetical protein
MEQFLKREILKLILDLRHIVHHLDNLTQQFSLFDFARGYPELLGILPLTLFPLLRQVTCDAVPIEFFLLRVPLPLI